MSIMPNYKFQTVKKSDGSLGYYVNGTELQDKEAYDRIQQKVNQTADKQMQDVESDFDNATKTSGNNESSSELDNMFSRAKGGKVKKSKVSTHHKNHKHPAW